MEYGSLTSMKIDNMREEHREKVITEAEKAAAGKAVAGKSFENVQIAGHNVSWMNADNKDEEGIFIAYRVKPVSGEATPIGSKVRIAGVKLVNYYDTPETTQGGALTVLEMGDGGTEPLPTMAIDVATAKEIGSELTAGATTSKKYIISGYVIATVGTNKGAVNYWIADAIDGEREVLIYGAKAEEEALLGAKISLENAKIQNYVDKNNLSTIETNGGTLVIEEQGNGEEVISPSEAIKRALKLTNDGKATYAPTFTIAGFVSGIHTERNPESDYPNSISFWMNDTYDEDLEWGSHTEEFLIYNGYSTEDLEFGNYVVVKHASLINYKGTAETVQNAYVEITDVPQALNTVEAKALNIEVLNGAIRVNANAPVAVYTISGQVLYNGLVNGEAIIPVAGNIVIVRVADQVAKIVL